jgi:hypothetical protein
MTDTSSQSGAGFVVAERMSFLGRCTADNSFSVCWLMRSASWELP